MRRSWALLGLVLPLLAGCGGGASKPSATAAASAKPSAAIASAAPASPTAAPTPSSSPEGSYTVKPGDTLSSIATANKTTTDAIMRANNLSDPDKLQIGQRLVIPSAQAQTSASASGAASAAASGALPSPASKPPPP
ncbi:MAG TPA: LysM peptidoglycan-binding domain-containing protein [Chloroflexota bacterium]|nr:LysM peptidoglycan-binding domain-containing protein [Chloroflexota bacterium]